MSLEVARKKNQWLAARAGPAWWVYELLHDLESIHICSQTLVHIREMFWD
jgi:hypothetical protein